jgi:hypothetical protein
MMSIIKTRATRRLSKPTGIVATRRKALPEVVHERIARRAYELWDLRGRRHGFDVEDWLDAENLVMDEIHEAHQ